MIPAEAFFRRFQAVSRVAPHVGLGIRESAVPEVDLLRVWWFCKKNSIGGIERAGISIGENRLSTFHIAGSFDEARWARLPRHPSAAFDHADHPCYSLAYRWIHELMRVKIVGIGMYQTWMRLTDVASPQKRGVQLRMLYRGGDHWKLFAG